MVAFDGSELCREAEAYYHDYLQDPRDPSVPRSVAGHIEGCVHCKGRVQSLREALCELDGHPQPALTEKDSRLIAELRSHFESLAEPLSCAHVKPFLCRLLFPSMRIRIPTPVTVHVDQCAACAKDLESLRQLDLGAEQLARLGGLLEQGRREDPCLCLRAQVHAAALASLSPESISSEILDHLCTCPRCRSLVYRQRQRLLDRARLAQAQTGLLACEQIATAELLDYVIPYGRRPVAFPTDRQRTLLEHVRSCPSCLERMQQIHRTVWNIAERADSGVTTVYTTQDRTGASRDDARMASYGAYPIDVQVAGSETAVALKDLGIAGRLKRRFCRPATTPFARVAFLAAAMIPLAVLFALSMPAASALSIRQVDRILARTRTVHVSVFGEDNVEPVQQLWISRPTGIVISELASERRIHDLHKGRTTVIPSGLGTLKHVDLSKSDRETVERSIRRFLASSLDDAPLDAELIHQPEDSAPAHAGCEIYELAWNRSSDIGTSLPRKLKIYVDPVTRLPVRQELSSWVPAANRWHVQTSVYEYPDENEIEAHRRTLLSVR